jgi:hypothetical protein
VPRKSGRDILVNAINEELPHAHRPAFTVSGRLLLLDTRTDHLSMLGIRANGHVGPSKADVVTCSICFIRCTSGSVLSTALLAIFAICTQITAIAPPCPIAQHSPSALS